MERPQLSFRIFTPSSYSRKAQRPRQQLEWQQKYEANQIAKHSSKPSNVIPVTPCHSESQLGNIDRILRSFQEKLSPSSGLSETMDAHAMPLIVSQFSHCVQGMYHMHSGFECFPDLFQKAETNSSLYLACQAVSSAYFSNRTRALNPTLMHRRIYGKSLRAVHLALLDPTYQRQDSTLLAVWLLCLYAVSLSRLFYHDS